MFQNTIYYELSNSNEVHCFDHDWWGTNFHGWESCFRLLAKEFSNEYLPFGVEGLSMFSFVRCIHKFSGFNDPKWNLTILKNSWCRDGHHWNLGTVVDSKYQNDYYENVY